MRRTSRLVAAVLLTAVAGLVTPSTPAHAAACSTAAGVTVVVDYHELGGGVEQVCDPDGGGKTASTLFPDNGFPLDYVQRQPGFVCRVSGKPADDPCVNTPPADAYWGLWWTDGESGEWTYSTESAGSLDIPEGGGVAFSWNGSTEKSPPGAAAPTHEESDDDGSGGSSAGAGGGTGGSGGSGGSAGSSGGESSTGSGTTSPDDGTSDGPDGETGVADGKRRDGKGGDGGDGRDTKPDREDRSGEESASTDPSVTASPSGSDAVAEPPVSPSDDGLPAWVAPALVGSLFAVAGVVALVRRRTTGS